MFYCTAFIHTLKITNHTNKNTAPLIIPISSSHMINLVHHKPNYIIYMYFILNGGLEAIQHQYQSTGYLKISSACVPLYSLYSHSKITAHNNKHTVSSIIPMLRSCKVN